MTLIIYEKLFPKIRNDWHIWKKKTKQKKDFPPENLPEQNCSKSASLNLFFFWSYCYVQNLLILFAQIIITWIPISAESYATIKSTNKQYSYLFLPSYSSPEKKKKKTRIEQKQSKVVFGWKNAPNKPICLSFKIPPPLHRSSKKKKCLFFSNFHHRYKLSLSSSSSTSSTTKTTTITT